MIKQKGTILKFKNNLAIIMTSDCRVVSILKQPGMYVGLEVLFNTNEIIHKKNKLVLTSQIVAAVAAMFIIMLAFFNPFNSNGVYAYVALDSNTSIEFELDKNNKILKVNSFNDDTSDLLKELDLKHKSVDVAIREVIKKSNLNESTILITACLKEQRNTNSGDKKENNSEELKKLIDICKSAAEDDTNEDIRSKVVETSYDYKKLANINKISIGRSIVYEKAKEQGVDLDIEEIKSKSIDEALKKVKIDDVGVIHDVKKAEVQKPAPESKRKEIPIEKMDPIVKKDPKSIVEPKDKPEVKQELELKEKPEVKQKTEPKDKSEVKQEIEPKDKPEVKPEIEPKDKPEVKPEIESKDKSEVKPEIEPKDKPEVKPEIEPKDKPEIKQEVEPKDKPEVKQEVELEAKPEVEEEKDKFEVNSEIEQKVKPEVKPENTLDKKPNVDTDPKEIVDKKPSLN